MRNNVLKVMLWGEEVGKLYWSEQLRAAVFNYHPGFVQKGIDIAPLTASIHGKHGKGEPVVGFASKKNDLYKGLPPFLADSLPDKWGDKLFNAWAANQKMSLKDITPVDRLAFIGKRAMGAFEFIPDIYPYNSNLSVDLVRLYDMASRIYREREDLTIGAEDNSVLSILYEMGTSAGGQHSKAVIAIENDSHEIRSGQIMHQGEFTYYLLKFSEGEEFVYSNVEMAYYLMAKEAGLNIMPSCLLEVENKQHFITQRFDRVDGEKWHTQTLAAMMPTADSYEDLFDVCDALDISVEEKKDLFRLTVFNFMAGNTDDHTKNFSFIMEKSGKWHVAPAYDLMFTVDLSNERYGSYHSMSLNGKDTAVTTADLLQFAFQRNIKDARNVLKEVCTAVSRFYEFAERCKIDVYIADQIEKWLAGNLPDEYTTDMTHYRGSGFSVYTTEDGFRITDFRIKESARHDYELWAVINEKAYRYLVDGESSLGISIKELGSYHMPIVEKIRLVETYLLPKAKMASHRSKA